MLEYPGYKFFCCNRLMVEVVAHIKGVLGIWVKPRIIHCWFVVCAIPIHEGMWGGAKCVIHYDVYDYSNSLFVTSINKFFETIFSAIEFI